MSKLVYQHSIKALNVDSAPLLICTHLIRLGYATINNFNKISGESCPHCFPQLVVDHSSNAVGRHESHHSHCQSVSVQALQVDETLPDLQSFPVVEV
jgi:hypothetical protein